MYGCGTWFLAFRETHVENGVLRNIFGRKRDDVTEDWSRLHNEELRDLYRS
jgi:hypothetical protein